MIRKVINIIIIVSISTICVCQTVEQKAYWRAQNYVQSNKIDSAILVLSNQTNCIECNLLEAELYLQKGNKFEAIRIYKDLSETIPSESFFNLAVIYAGLGFADESLAYLTKHFGYPNPVFYSGILSYKEFEQINNSIEWKDFWSENRYSKNSLKLEEAEYLIKIGDNDAALSILENLNYSSKREYVYYLIAGIYLDYENLSLSKIYIDLAVDSDFKFISALELKRDLEIKQQTFDLALRTNAQLLKLDPYNCKNNVVHANILYQYGISVEAEKLINNYLDYFPNDEQANHLKTQILSGREDYREALINLNLLVDQNPSNANYFIERADIYYKLDSWQFAANDYSMALDIDPQLDVVWYRYGMCQYNLDFDKKACSAWQKAANLKNRDAVNMLFEICE